MAEDPCHHRQHAQHHAPPSADEKCPNQCSTRPGQGCAFRNAVNVGAFPSLAAATSAAEGLRPKSPPAPGFRTNRPRVSAAPRQHCPCPPPRPISKSRIPACARISSLRQPAFQQLSLFEGQAQQVTFVTSLAVSEHGPEHVEWNSAIGHVIQRCKHAVEFLPFQKESGKPMADSLMKEVGQDLATHAIVGRALQLATKSLQAFRKITVAETSHRHGQCLRVGFRKHLITTTEIPGLKFGAKRVERVKRQVKRHRCRRYPRCEQTSQGRAHR